MTTAKSWYCTEEYEIFIAPLQVVLDPTDFERVQFAYFLSKYGHSKQLRDDGVRYFDHPKSAAWIYIAELGGRDPDIIIELLMHDVPEDTYLISFYRISLNFGMEIALDLRAITKLPKGKEDIKAYFGRIIARGPRVILVKLCDRLHNLLCLSCCSIEKQRRQIAETKELLMPTLLSALRFRGGQWQVYADALELKMNQAMEAVISSWTD